METRCNVVTGIRRLQLTLLKIALVLGVEVYTPIKYQGLLEPNPNTGKEDGATHLDTSNICAVNPGLLHVLNLNPYTHCSSKW